MAGIFSNRPAIYCSGSRSNDGNGAGVLRCSLRINKQILILERSVYNYFTLIDLKALPFN